MNSARLSAALQVIGLALLSVGVGFFSIPAALAIVGAWALVVGMLMWAEEWRR